MPEFQFDLEVAPAAQPIKLPARRRSVFDWRSTRPLIGCRLGKDFAKAYQIKDLLL
jgi:hypothetical protein